MIQLRDEYALQEREENAGRDGQKDSTAVNEDLALSIKERTTIARQSRMDLELRIQKLKDEGNLSPEAEELIRSAEKTGRDEAGLDRIMAEVEAGIEDSRVELAEGIYSRKHNFVPEE